MKNKPIKYTDEPIGEVKIVTDFLPRPKDLVLKALTPEEQELLSSFEKGEWESVDNVEEEMASAKEAASSFLIIQR